MNVSAFQRAISQKFPTKVNEQLYLYNKLGKLLFKDEWSRLSFMDTSNITDNDMPSMFIGVMAILQHFEKDERSIIVNFMFQEAVKRLSCNNQRVSGI